MRNRWAVRDNEINLKINIKLAYPQGNNQLCSTGHNVFAFLWARLICITIGILQFTKFWNSSKSIKGRGKTPERCAREEI